jgi:hypothetical protein
LLSIRSLLPLLLVQAMFLATSVASLHAQETSPQDLQKWIAEDPQYNQTMVTLYAVLEDYITRPQPRGYVSQPFKSFIDAPNAFAPMLQTAMSGLPRWQNGGPLPDKLLTLYQAMYPLDSTCDVLDLPLPQSLNDAIQQVVDVSGQLVDRFNKSFTDADAQFLRDNHGVVISMLQVSPWGGGLPDQKIAILEQYLDILDQADPDLMTCSAMLWGRFLDEQWQLTLQQLMQAHPDAGAQIILQESTPFGQVIFGGTGNLNLLTGNILFFADLGGDDIYALRTRDAWSGLPQLVIDFAGNDIYESQEPGGYAAGIGSTAFLVDHQGNDTYHGVALTQGFGLMGVGILHDRQGDDEYNANSMAQGMSLYGIGLLLDTQGNDRYQVQGLGQGTGMTQGVGILSDLSGNDSYLATGLVPTNYGTPGLSDSWSQGIGVGVRDITPGGVGILQDENGNDDYRAGSFSQGGGYFYGLGLLKDNGNQDDTYLGARYNFGWGAHVGMGYFLEAGGNDYYKTRQFVSSGLSWDLSLVLFEDLAGDDLHEAGDFSLGASAHRSIMIFHDHDGSDTYLGTTPATPTQGPPNLSLFLDTGLGENRFDGMKSHAACSINTAQGLGFTLVMREIPTPDSLHCNEEQAVD